MNEPRQHHSPVKFSPEQFDAHEGGTDPARVSEAAHLAAHALVSRGREADDPEVHQRLVQLTDEQGLEGIAELWAQAPAVSLPGALWRLYALRAAARTDPHRMGRWFAAGKGTAQVSDVVAGVAGLPGAEEICQVADTILSGAFNGDFDVALERFAAFCRVIALGQERTQDIPSLAVRHADQRIPRLSRTANELDAAAKAWRIGALD
ncbi:hypothetical protein CKW39_08610 [Kocuria sp. WRN011]|uniref:DNA-directed RNA polymerase subunit beta n=1 Tax=Kocuria carniphila TaxID=262208 RepID=A0ABV3V3A8_9MICC|nr:MULTISPECIES: hypothetical protein [Kocuria]MCT1801186.1 hypothetical protein [Kocuria carniphila]PBB08418.1 hypothetical protein CKW39_08610 [Kocuria sp. WRN011]PZP26002.1 MAG: hypothetical protein DI613_15890 [Kocuria rhizophila]